MQQAHATFEVQTAGRGLVDPLFAHVGEGTDDMPAHMRAALTATTLTVPRLQAGWCSAPGRASTCSSTGVAGMHGRWWGT